MKKVKGKLPKRKIKLFWYGDICSKTGFAHVSESVLTRLQATGDYDISVLGLNYRGDYSPLQRMFKIWPVSDNDLWGQGKFPALLRQEEPDVVLTLNDIDCLNWFVKARMQGMLNHRWIWYAPLDSWPNHPNALKAMMFCDRFITFTRWGQDKLQKQVPNSNIDVVPHGCNTKTFYKITNKDILEELKVKKQNMCQNKEPYLVGFVGRNQYRKEIPRLLEAFKKFKKKVPNAYLYLHCCPIDNAPGYPLPQILEYMGLADSVIFPKLPNGKFIAPGQGVPPEELNEIYNMFDQFVLPSNAGGWELPLTEAMAVECPVVTTNFAAMSEVGGNNRSFLTDIITEYCFVGTNLGRKGIVDIDKLANNMLAIHEDQIFNDSEKCKEKIKNGKEFVKKCNWDYVASEFDRIIKEEYQKPIEEEITRHHKVWKPGHLLTLDERRSKYEKEKW